MELAKFYTCLRIYGISALQCQSVVQNIRREADSYSPLYVFAYCRSAAFKAVKDNEISGYHPCQLTKYG